MQKINAIKIIALIYKLNTINTLFIRKNIVEVKEFKKLIIFRIIFKENKRLLKSNDF